MTEKTQKVSWLYGALLGALLTPSLMAVLFIGERFAQLPFLPFDFFNWVARVLPGPLITFGIDRMVDLLILVGLGSNLDEAAKTAEQLMGLVTFWAIGVVITTLVVQILNRLKTDNNIAAIGASILAGMPFILISMAVNVSSPQPVAVQIIWLVLLYAGYGAVLDWAYNGVALISKNQPQGEAPEASVQGIDRRKFLIQVGGASATLSVVGAGLGALLGGTPGEGTPNTGSPVATGDLAADGSGNPLPNANDPLLAAPGTRAEYTPVRDHYRIDILSGGLPSIPEDYVLPIFGEVANEVEWTLADIRAMPAQSEFITMSCISNRIAGSLISTTKWTGVSLQHILEQVQPTENAVAIKIIGADNFDEYVSLDMIRNDDRIMLTYDFDDAPLPLRNGFPLRIHIPNRYGMKQPKWILSMEFVAAEDVEPGYWVRRGWSAEAIVNPVSVIDTVATDAIYSEGDQMFVPVGGMAWAGDRPIVRVQVRVDEGEWMDADLRAPLSERAWTIWRYDWPFVEGTHTFEVRAYHTDQDADGEPDLQPTASQGTRPDGATGIHEVTSVVQGPSEEEEPVAS